MNPDPTITPENMEPVSAQKQAQNFTDDVRERAEKAFSDSDHYVRENPWPVVLGAAAVGVLIGYALGHRPEPTAREKYIDEPLEHARELLTTLLAPVASRLQDQYAHARSTMEDVADELHDADPLKMLAPLGKKAGRFGKKMKFW